MEQKDQSLPDGEEEEEWPLVEASHVTLTGSDDTDGKRGLGRRTQNGVRAADC